jgi:prophage antirepressor-like protein
MKTAIVKQFNDQPVEFLTDEKELFITAEMLGNALGYKKPMVAIYHLYNRHTDLLRDFVGVTKLVTPGGVQEVVVCNEIGCIIIAMKANTPKAKEFIKWAAKITTDYRHEKLQKRLPYASLIKELSKLIPDISLVMGLGYKNQAY